MEFAEKLNFLFELSHAEGKALAAAMNVTPPQISKMRSGLRGLPKNPEAARVLAAFFVRRCGSALQRDALARAMRAAQVRNIESERALTELLLRWLRDEPRQEERAARNADELMLRHAAAGAAETDGQAERGRVLRSPSGTITAFYGVEGKRAGALTFLDYLLKLGRAYEISLLSDEDGAWLVGDAPFSRRLTERVARLTGQGCSFRRIAGPPGGLDQAFDALERWFPLYTAGTAAPYYYKRMRDNLNRVTIYVVPDVAVLFSFSVGAAAAGDAVCFFTTDPGTVNAMAARFERYLALCGPALRVYSAETDAEQMHECLLRHERCRTACMQTGNALSFITLPWDVAVALRGGGRDEEREAFLGALAQRFKAFTANLEQEDFVDLLRLADTEDVLAGAVPVPGAGMLGAAEQYYTPAAYLAHLKSILYLLRHRPHYHAVVREAGAADAPLVCVKEGQSVLLTRAQAPVVVFEVSERYLADAFTEYLRRLLPPDCRGQAQRRRSAELLRAQIAELETRTGKRGKRDGEEVKSEE